MTEPPSRPMSQASGRSRRLAVWGSAVLIVLLAAGAWLKFHRAGARFVTATPAYGTVQETVALSGTLAPQQQGAVNFAVSGTVASVAVSAGQTVKAGQVLATLDTALLQSQLAQAEAQLAQAKATLATDQAGGTSSAVTTVANDQSQLSTAEAALNATETEDSVKLSQAQAAVAAAESQLKSDEASDAPASVIAKDETALTDAQDTVAVTEAQNQQSLDQAQAQVSTVKGQLALAQQQESSQAALAAAEESAAAAAVTADEFTVQNDQAAVSDAVLKAPYAGVVQAVNIAVGDTVGGGAGSGGSGSTGSGSSTGAGGSSGASAGDIVLTGTGGYQVTADASVSDVGELKVGEQATITVTAGAAPVYGTVSSVGSQAVTTSGVSEFPVVISVTGHPANLLDGAAVTVSVLVAQASNVLTVPTSAVHTLGSRTYVTVLTPSGTTTLHAITVGLEGTTLTQIKSGLTTKDTVVLARTNAAVPGVTGGTGFLRRGFGGGGFGGGFGGGGFGGGGGG